MPAADDAFLAKLVELELYSNVPNLRQHLDVFFGDVRLAGRSVLDVGGGKGLLTFAAAQRGARDAVLMEPELAGSTEGVTRRFQERARALGLEDRVSLVSATLQAWQPGERRFDVVLSANSINHWDEPACIEAHRSDAARATYVGLLRKLFGMTRPGGDLIVTDAARRNLFGDLGLRNPLSRDIEWEKHQSPHFWAGICAEAGFAEPRVSWTTFNSIGRLAGGRGAALLDNFVAGYCTGSTFRLAMKRPG